ncbi:MAG: hypothetical protein FRX49_06646 [Trebouxia sp. A1-2]|nr:MAG: hypothetical protein FRX49_06646 [Trebouxia sp. A1-2]
MPPSQASEHHKRVTTSVDDDDIDPQVDQQGCGKVYSQLEVKDTDRLECLGENNRDWRLCQKAQLYRDILKAAKRFPSIKRNQILEDIKTEFHANKAMSNKEEIAKARQVAISSLQQLRDYVGLGGSGDGQVQLKGTV